VVQNTYNKIIICGSATEKNYSKIEETSERKKFTKCTTAYFFKADVPSLSMK